MANQIHYNLYRFGMAEVPIGRLINGDVPDDDEERWQMVEAPRSHIRRMLDEHTRAQQALRACRDSGRPFVLYLRSFSSELRTERSRGAILSTFTPVPLLFQQSLQQLLASDGIPVVKLHGGSDGLVSGLVTDALVLSTHARNWEATAVELIDAAAAIVFVISEMSPGVSAELTRLRERGRAARCLIALAAGPVPTGRDLIDADGVRASVRDFANVFELPEDGDGAFPDRFVPALRGLLSATSTEATFQHSLEAEFTYLEPDFVESEDFVRTQQVIWAELRTLRVLFEDTYWAALKSRGISYEGFTFPIPWKSAHKVYGLAIATADFVAAQEALSYLHMLYIVRLADYALAIPQLAQQYRELATEMYGQVPDLEARYARGPDVLKYPRTIDTAVTLLEMARRRDAADDATASVLYQSAVIGALRAEDGDSQERLKIAADACSNWARLQADIRLPVWAAANFSLAVVLFRELALEDPSRFEPDLATCLTDFASFHCGRLQWRAAEAPLELALSIRRGFAGDAREDLAMLGSVLSKLAIVRDQLGQLDSASALLREAIRLCESRLPDEREAVIDLTWLQAFLSQCLVRTTAGRSEARILAEQAHANLDAVAAIDRSRAEAIGGLVRTARAASAAARLS